jgi:hypothetical protein
VLASACGWNAGATGCVDDDRPAPVEYARYCLPVPDQWQINAR